MGNKQVNAIKGSFIFKSSVAQFQTVDSLTHGLSQSQRARSRLAIRA